MLPVDFPHELDSASSKVHAGMRQLLCEVPWPSEISWDAFAFRLPIPLLPLQASQSLNHFQPICQQFCSAFLNDFIHGFDLISQPSGVLLESNVTVELNLIDGLGIESRESVSNAGMGCASCRGRHLSQHLQTRLSRLL